jgi:hypothetical protein
VQVTEGNGYCLMLVFAACRMSLVGSRESQSLGSSIGHQRWSCSPRVKSGSSPNTPHRDPNADLATPRRNTPDPFH